MLSHGTFSSSAMFLCALHLTTVSWWSSVILLRPLCRQITADVVQWSICARRRVRKSEGHFRWEGSKNTFAVLLNQWIQSLPNLPLSNETGPTSFQSLSAEGGWHPRAGHARSSCLQYVHLTYLSLLITHRCRNVHDVAQIFQQDNL